MAKEYIVEIDAHPSIYKPRNRKLKIYFSEPESGINSQTGILLIIPGFGANSTLNGSIKMRNSLADQFNMITVQCDYFGWEFMQQVYIKEEFESLNLITPRKDMEKVFSDDELKTIYSGNEVIISNMIKCLDEHSHAGFKQHNIKLTYEGCSNQTYSYYNDMGIMQALDNISSILVIQNILKDNGMDYCKDKIVVYGHSHGAYLAYLCNAFAPNLISTIIDNSAWLYPIYTYIPRIMDYPLIDMEIKYEYLVNPIQKDLELLHLHLLYEKSESNCNIICFQGTTDTMIIPQVKKEFLNSFKHATYIEISPDKVDGKVFKSTNHGLDSNHIRLYTLVENQYNLYFKNLNSLTPLVKYKTKMYDYSIDYTHGLPIFSYSKL